MTALVIVGYVLMMIIAARTVVIPFAKRDLGSVDNGDAPAIVMLSFFWPLIIPGAIFFGAGWLLWQLITLNIPNPVSAIKKRRQKPTTEELEAEIARLERELGMNDN